MAAREKTREKTMDDLDEDFGPTSEDVSQDQPGEELPEDLLDLSKPATLPPPRPGRPRRQPSAEALPDVGSLRAQVYAQAAAQNTMFERVDQLAKLLDQQYQQSQGLMTQMQETLQLWQQSFQTVQDLADKLARIAAATVKMYQLQIEQQDENALF
jgi:hypothetical protein